MQGILTGRRTAASTAAGRLTFYRLHRRAGQKGGPIRKRIGRRLDQQRTALGRRGRLNDGGGTFLAERQIAIPCHHLSLRLFGTLVFIDWITNCVTCHSDVPSLHTKFNRLVTQFDCYYYHFYLKYNYCGAEAVDDDGSTDPDDVSKALSVRRTAERPPAPPDPPPPDGRDAFLLAN